MFTYGSLMFDPVWTRVVRGRYDSVPARLPGYRREGVSGERYPGVIADPSGAVSGRLYLSVHADDLARLDDFEGPDYDRVEVTVSPARDGASGWSAECYRWREPSRLTGAPWDPVDFERRQLIAFLDEYARAPRP